MEKTLELVFQLRKASDAFKIQRAKFLNKKNGVIHMNARYEKKLDRLHDEMLVAEQELLKHVYNGKRPKIF